MKRKLVGRRDFIKKMGMLVLSYLTIRSYAGSLKALGFGQFKENWKAESLGLYYAPPLKKGVRFAMVLDTKACIGCRRCQYACVKENNISRFANMDWIRIYSMEEGAIDLEKADPNYTEAPLPGHWYLPVQCYQCENPPCVQVCPVYATWKEPDGIVVVDYRKCIGCRYCVVACPYGARRFNWRKPEIPTAEINRNPNVPIRPVGVVEKCTFCIHRVRKGRTTACVEACPVGARKFGDLNDPDSVISKLLESRQVFRLKEELGANPRFFYLG